MTNEINVNQDIVLLPSTTVASANPDVSADQSNLYWVGCVIYLNITQASGTGGLTLNIQFKDPASGNYITVFTATTAYTTTGLRVFAFGPASNWSNQNLQADLSTALPRTWRVQITKGDASSYTYSVGCSMIK
jgi:hypothetical protein